MPEFILFCLQGRWFFRRQRQKRSISRCPAQTHFISPVCCPCNVQVDLERAGRRRMQCQCFQFGTPAFHLRRHRHGRCLQSRYCVECHLLWGYRCHCDGRSLAWPSTLQLRLRRKTPRARARAGGASASAVVAVAVVSCCVVDASSDPPRCCSAPQFPTSL